MQQKIRINDLARELEVKSKVILDLLIKVGVTEKKTHSSSIEVDEAERVKKYYAEHGEPGSSSTRSLARAVGRVQAQDRPVAYLQARRRVEGDHAEGRPACRPRARARLQPTPSLRRSRRWLLPRRYRHDRLAVVAKPPAVAASAAQAAPVETPKPAPRFITPQSVARPPAAIIIPPKAARRSPGAPWPRR